MVKAARKEAKETDRNIYGHVENKADIDKIFNEIRTDTGNAKNRPALTELYKRAGYMITLTYAPSWEEKFGKQAGNLRKEAEEEFRKTARLINKQAAKIGTEADYDEAWGRMKQ
jgi:hypothetical protein